MQLQLSPEDIAVPPTASSQVPAEPEQQPVTELGRENHLVATGAPAEAPAVQGELTIVSIEAAEAIKTRDFTPPFDEDELGEFEENIHELLVNLRGATIKVRVIFLNLHAWIMIRVNRTFALIALSDVYF